MKRVLLAWIGTADFRAAEDQMRNGHGPIGTAVKELEFTDVVLLNDHFAEKVEDYRRWIENQTAASVEIHQRTLSSPTKYSEIYRAAYHIVAAARKKHGDKAHLTFHVSPGTWAMASVWIMLAKTRFKAELIESSKEAGIQKVVVPFDISAEFIPDLLRESDARLQTIAAGETPASPEFEHIIHRSPQMKKLIDLARRVAIRNIPVLIEGESGTGKELLAKAIHQASPRRTKIFCAVNCGAIPAELVESELFGHLSGSFTGAVKDKKGLFENADQGTVFLDEIGELPLSAQVKLLRVLQEGEITPVGATAAKKIDVRIISATNRHLAGEAAAGRFREDLFYRLAVFLLRVPPLREREGDLTLLISELWKQINEQNVSDFGSEAKVLKPAAQNLLLKHDWSGNVRELQNTLLRLSVLADGKNVSEKDVESALFQPISKRADQILDQSFGGDFSLESILREVEKHYLARALNRSGGNKSKAAKLLGLANYQTLSNKLNRYDITNEEDT